MDFAPLSDNFFASSKLVSCGESDEAPLIILVSYEPIAERVALTLSEGGLASFRLLEVVVKDWENDLSPWPNKAVFPKGKDFGSGADKTLEAIERVLRKIDTRTPLNIICGYSLAGLFALYCGYKSNRFSAAVSVSGSLWFPGFDAFVHAHSLSPEVKRVVLSLGDKEPQTKNAVMASVGTLTEKTFRHYLDLGLDARLHWNSGGHFADEVDRLARAILEALR